MKTPETQIEKKRKKEEGRGSIRMDQGRGDEEGRHVALRSPGSADQREGIEVFKCKNKTDDGRMISV